MGSSTTTEGESDQRTRQQAVVADLGQQAVEADDLDELLDDAAAAVADGLDTTHSGVLELLPHGNALLVRASVDESAAAPGGSGAAAGGSEAAASGSEATLGGSEPPDGGTGATAGRRDATADGRTVPVQPDSQVGTTLERGEAVVVEDLRADDRHSGVGVPAADDAVSGVSVSIGPRDDPWGALVAADTEQRAFTEGDVHFVQSVANVLGTAVEHERAQSELEEIYGRISDAVFALDEEWRFTYLNERAHELINPDGETLVGESVWDRFPDAVDRAFKPKYERAMYEQEVVSFEEYYPEPVDAWFDVRAYPSETGLSVYFRDVTDRKQRDRDLEETERRFEAIFEDPNILVGLLEPDGSVLDINQTAMEYVDADLGDVTGEPFWETPWWGEGDDVGDDVREWTERAAEGEYVDFEADLTSPDGERYTLSGYFRPVTDEDGNVVSIIVSDRDVTERKQRERELEESERRYRSLAEYFPNGLVTLYDHDLEYTLAAGQGFDRIPHEPADLEGRAVEEVWDEDTAAVLAPAFEAALDGEERSVELAYAGRQWVVHAVPITDEDGEVFAGMTMAQDITERTDRERELARYETIVETMNDGIYVKDEDGRFTMVNEAYAQLTGYDREELLGAHASLVVDEDAIQESRTVRTESEDDPGNPTMEATIQTADGDTVPAEGTFSTLETGDGEQQEIGVVRDISERKARERELERALGLLEKAERIADVGGWEIDTETGDVFWSDHIFDLLEVPGDEEPPLDEALAMYHDEDQQIVEDAVEEAMASGEPFDVEVRLRTAASGDVRWLRLQGVPEMEDGEVVSLRGAAQDITDQLQREQRLEELVDKLEESNERLEQFAYAASHDLQEPLRMVSSYLQLIEQRYADELDADGEEFLDYAVDGADRMRDMIEGLLEYSRVDTRGDPFEPVDLDAVLEDVRDDLQVKIEESGAEIESESLPTVEGDGGQLRQVYQNLLENAIEYSGDEPPHVEFGAERRYAAGREEWVLSVRDEGIGVDPDDADRVFEVFQRLQAREESDGTGIGLALCERIVERHEGDIWMDSTPGEGTTVYFTLPVTREDGEA